MRYHNQCISPSNVPYAITTSAFHLTMCHTVPRPVTLTFQCVMRYHDQCNLAICHPVPQPVPFTWQCVMQYHDHCISPGNVLCGTTTNVYIKSVGNINFYTPAPPEGDILFYLCPSFRESVLLSVQDIFRRIFLCNY